MNKHESKKYKRILREYATQGYPISVASQRALDHILVERRGLWKAYPKVPTHSEGR